MPVKQFGGKIHLDLPFNDTLTDTSSDLYKQFFQQYTVFLNAAYNSSWYISSIITSFEAGSTIVNYEVLTENLENVDAETVQTTFESFLGSNSFYPNCTCDDAVCSSTDPAYPPLQANSSCMDAGTRSACERAVTGDMCSDDTVTCSAEDGVVTCECVNESGTYDPDQRVCTG